MNIFVIKQLVKQVLLVRRHWQSKVVCSFLIGIIFTFARLIIIIDSEFLFPNHWNNTFCVKDNVNDMNKIIIIVLVLTFVNLNSLKLLT